MVNFYYLLELHILFTIFVSQLAVALTVTFPYSDFCDFRVNI